MLLFQILCRIASCNYTIRPTRDEASFNYAILNIALHTVKEKICTKEYGFKSLINKNFPKIFVWTSEKTGNAHPLGFRPECLLLLHKVMLVM